MSRLPGFPGCIPLIEVEQRENATVNLVGVVVDCRPPKMSSGSDWMTTFKLCDQTCPDEASSVSIRAFRATPDQLPQIRSNGDIIIIKSVNLKMFRDKIYGLTTRSSSWIISYLPTLVNTTPMAVTQPPSTRPTPVELAHMKGLRNWWTSIGGAASWGIAHAGNHQNSPPGSIPPPNYYQAPPMNGYQASPPSYQVSSMNGYQVGNNYQMPPVNYHPAAAIRTTPLQNPSAAYIGRGSQKFSLIRNMELEKFYDLIGIVVKVFSANSNCTVYITDYTKNPMLHSYEWPGNSDVEEDDEGNFVARSKGGDGEWPGPWGQYTLQITLWDGHATGARLILQDAVGAYVGLRNVRARKNRDGRLEGAMHGDRKNPGRSDIFLMEDEKDPRIKDIIQRKKEYTRRFDSKKHEFERKRKTKLVEPKRARSTQDAERIVRESERNQEIICEAQNITVPTPISKILNPEGVTTPYINRNYRIFCRVVDYWPDRLEEFSVRNTADNADAWVWLFVLLVEDKSGSKMRVIVGGKEAEGFLGIDAANLRKNKDTLGALREKLLTLWGDLQERKEKKMLKEAQLRKRKRNDDKGPENKRETDELGKPIKRHSGKVNPDSSGDESSHHRAIWGNPKMFQACVREYGVERKGVWERKHKLFGTFIRSSSGSPQESSHKSSQGSFQGQHAYH